MNVKALFVCTAQKMDLDSVLNLKKAKSSMTTDANNTMLHIGGHLTAVKHNKEKPVYSLLTDDLRDEVENLVRVLMFGASKYGRKNWQEDIPDLNFWLDAVERHIVECRRGQMLDDESGEPHFIHSACGLLFATWHAKRGVR